MAKTKDKILIFLFALSVVSCCHIISSLNFSFEEWIIYIFYFLLIFCSQGITIKEKVVQPIREVLHHSAAPSFKCSEHDDKVLTIVSKSFISLLFHSKSCLSHFDSFPFFRSIWEKLIWKDMPQVCSLNWQTMIKKWPSCPSWKVLLIIIEKP